MKYLKSERVEIQEVYVKYISYIEEHITDSRNHLCHMDLDLERCDKNNEVKVCGWNDRMLPNAVTYLKSEQPSRILNRIIYNKPMFRKDIDLTSNNTWWLVADFIEEDINMEVTNTTCNLEKIEFLQHLIKKLR